MDQTHLSAFLSRPIGRLSRAFAPQRIILFGSYAKESASPNSDVDLLIITDLEGDPLLNLRRARQLVADIFPIVDIVMCSPDDAASASIERSPFIFSVLETGITVYGQSP